MNAKEFPYVKAKVLYSYSVFNLPTLALLQSAR